MTTELTVRVVGGQGLDARSLDRLTRQLAADLRAAGPFAVRPLPATAGPGGKSGVVEQIGSLLLSGVLSAAGVGAIRDVIVAYLARSNARAVHVRRGDNEVTLDGVSAADLAAVTRQLAGLLDDQAGGPAAEHAPTGKSAPPEADTPAGTDAPPGERPGAAPPGGRG